MAGKAIEFERLHVSERFCGAKARDVRDSRMSSEVQEHSLAVQSAHAAVVQSNLNSLRCDEAALSQNQLSAAFLVFVHVHADKAVHHPPLAGAHLTHFD